MEVHASKDSTNVRSERSTEVTSDNQSVEEKHTEQVQTGIVAILHDFPQHGFLLLLFGILALGGSIAALCFKIDSPMFVQILGLVAAGCGIGIGADTIKHFKKNTKARSKPPAD